MKAGAFSLAILMSMALINNAYADGDMKVLTCESDKKLDDGQPYNEWQAVFDSSAFSKEVLDYELAKWNHKEKYASNGKKSIQKMKVTPTILYFYKDYGTNGRKEVLLLHPVDRTSLRYGGKHSNIYDSGQCSVTELKNKI